MFYCLRQLSTSTEEMLLRLLGIKRDWTPWGTAGCLYIYILFFSTLLLFIQFEPAICSAAPRSAIVSCLLLQKKKKKKKRCETFLNRQSATGRVDWVQKAKSFTFGTHGELGTTESKVNREEV